MSAQPQCSFNPALAQDVRTMTESDLKTAKKIGRFLAKGMHSQVVLDSASQLKLSLKPSKQRLEYLQLGIQKPKALPSLEPLIDDEFLLTERELKLKNRESEETPRVMKRKIKA